MKKLLTIMLVLTMIVTLFASCDKGNSSSTPEVNKLESAKSYIDALYKKTNGSKTAVDFDVVGVVRIDGVAFNIEWTVDAPDYVAIEPAEDGKTVTVNVNEKPDVEVNYTLTATVKDEEGNTASCAFKYLIPAFEGEPTYADLVNDAYALADGEALPSPYRLFGEVISIDTAWSDEYKNITVTIVVDGLTEQPIQCYRLKGDGAEALAVGDKITVEGTLKNYKGTIEFDAGCTLVGLGEHPSQAATLDAAYALADGKSIPTPSVLKGEIISVDTAWSDEYKNITVTMVVDGNTEKPVQCYRLKGDGAEALAVGDVITVVGTLVVLKCT
ncbi:MAG: hypothetical protein U0M06_06095, partial [Clostridia bacterium]|nr:hypothetical protein [Clostridia bacterium]